MTSYASTDDVIAMWRSLTAAEIGKANDLLPTISAEIRLRAAAVGKDFDEMIAEDEDLEAVAKSVVVDVFKRYINDGAVDSPSMSQMSQAAGGYSVSGTFLVPGGGLFLKKSELARLGLRKQKIGVIDLC